MKTKARKPQKEPQRMSDRRVLFQRAIHEAGEAQQHLANMTEALLAVAAPECVARISRWARPAKRMAEVTARLQVELQARLEMYAGIADREHLIDPDEGFEPEPDDCDFGRLEAELKAEDDQQRELF